MRDLDEIRLNLGVCQQADLLFEELSVEQNLQLIARLKLIPSHDLYRRVGEVLDLVSLDKVKNT